MNSSETRRRMTREEILALPCPEPLDRTLGLAVGREVMGYTVYHYSKGCPDYWMLLDRDGYSVALLETGVSGLHVGERSTEDLAWCDTPLFEADLNACADMERELARRGLARPYGRFLTDLIRPPFYEMINSAPDPVNAAVPSLTFLLATATPVDRCRAAILVLLDDLEAADADL